LSNPAFALMMPNLVKIAEVALSMPVSNAWPERGASAVKRIKTRLRGSLRNRMLNSLMMLTINGPEAGSPLARELIEKSVKNWQNAKVRRKTKAALRSRKVDVGCQSEAEAGKGPSVASQADTEESEDVRETDEETVEEVTTGQVQEEALEVEEEENIAEVLQAFNLCDGGDSASDVDSAFGSDSDEDFY
jgi:hypothetical protein